MPRVAGLTDPRAELRTIMVLYGRYAIRMHPEHAARVFGVRRARLVESHREFYLFTEHSVFWNRKKPGRTEAS